MACRRRRVGGRESRCDAAGGEGAGGFRYRCRHRREMSRQHFVHGFLEQVDGIDFAHKVEMGIRADRYKVMVPQVVGEVRLKGRVHATEAKLARAHTKKKLKITMPGPMTIVDTIADEFYGDRVKMAFAFAGLLNQEARALQADGVDVIQFDEPAFNVYMEEAAGWGIEALDRAAEGSPAPKPCTSATATGFKPISIGRRASATSGDNTKRYFPRLPQAGSIRSRSNAAIRACRRN